MRTSLVALTNNFLRKVWSTYQLSMRNIIKFQDHFNLIPTPGLTTRLPYRSQRAISHEILITYLSSSQSPPKFWTEKLPYCEMLQVSESQIIKHKDSPLKDRLLPTIEQAKGEWIVLLQSDEIPSSKLMDTLNQVPVETEIVYWDVLSTQNGQVRPWYKPGWSPELLLSAPLLCGSAIRRKLLLESAREFFASGEFSWTDLIIQILTHKNLQFLHLPLFLSQLHSPLPIRQHLATAELLIRTRVHPQATSTLDTNNIIRHEWPIDELTVSIIIPTRNNYFVVRRCVTSLLEITRYRNFHVILMDDHSNDPELIAWYKTISTHPQIRIINNPDPFNYSKVNNLGARSSDGELLLFLNNDTEIIEANWLDEMVRWAQLPEIGIVGAQLLYPDHTIQHNGIVVGLGGHAGHLYQGLPSGSETIFGSTDWIRNISAVTGACMMMRRSVFDEVNGFNEDLGLVFNDVELCIKVLQKGYRNIVTPFAQLIHYEGLSRDKALPQEDVEIGTALLLPWVERGDPYFTPALSHAVSIPTPRRWFEPDPVRRLKWINYFLSRRK